MDTHEQVRHRIADYATQREARIAARWMRRGADRDLGQGDFRFEIG
ncbi:MAG: hypothetical protein NW201_12545 [Gemmatimonadales bacterium]|nr:hypothetical protein [Gemmatimonadales bacterium]